jgi:hypothetical protein
VTAVYKGSVKKADTVLLRSYDSRREPAPEFDCTIWEAGRATSAIGLAFKPIQIGQSVFHDDGAGYFNPSVEALDEAVVNEWPGREVGVFVSVGTGKRPKSSDSNSSAWYEGFLGEFAEARRRLIAKIEGCETIHEYMKKEHLLKRNVNIETYYRLNVEVGVGEFGMNEWHRLSEISTNTRRYMARDEEQKMVQGISAKLAKIHFANQRWKRLVANVPELIQTSSEMTMPLAVELPGDFPTYTSQNTPSSRQSYESGADKLSIPSENSPSPRSSAERLRLSPNSGNQSFAQRAPKPSTPPTGRQPHPPTAAAGGVGQNHLDDSDRLVVTAPTPAQYRHAAAGADKSAEDQTRRSKDTNSSRPTGSHPSAPVEPPPLPPKTPLPEHMSGGKHRHGTSLPYPMDDEPPPAVNMAKKPEYRGR